MHASTSNKSRALEDRSHGAIHQHGQYLLFVHTISARQQCWSLAVHTDKMNTSKLGSVWLGKLSGMFRVVGQYASASFCICTRSPSEPFKLRMEPDDKRARKCQVERVCFVSGMSEQKTAQRRRQHQDYALACKSDRATKECECLAKAVEEEKNRATSVMKSISCLSLLSWADFNLSLL